MKKYSIEYRAFRAWGRATTPECCAWITKEGVMINGSYDGHQRDRDHRDISGFFKTSKFEDPGSSWIYVKKFMRRGNIRVGCSRCGYYMEICGTPTEPQLYIIDAFHTAASKQGIEFGIGKRDHKDFGKITQYSYYGYLDHLRRYSKLTVPETYLNAA